MSYTLINRIIIAVNIALLILMIVAHLMRKKYPKESKRCKDFTGWSLFNVEVLSFLVLHMIYNESFVFLPFIVHHWYTKRERYGGITVILSLIWTIIFIDSKYL